MSVPIPVGRVEFSDKDASQPFPCQSRACGCKSARQCWTKCCCHTPSQRKAWAQKNGVTPPDYAIVIDEVSKDSGPKGHGSQVPRACCLKKSPAACDAKTKAELPPDDHSLPSAGASKRKWVLSWSALGCQGRSTDFTLLPWTILISPLKVTVGIVEFGPTVLVIDSEPLSIYLELDTPPPRQLLS
ncbi:MAG: hypothetical protein IT423_05940 [Pirellulaceae bacterium]|nr:hypothetical protein [Pirellulaceae bacterium]